MSLKLNYHHTICPLGESHLGANKLTNNNTFNGLGLSDTMIKRLTSLGYHEPTIIQQDIIPLVLSSSDDLIAQAATGTGKTGAVGIPLVDNIDMRTPGIQALILAPTRELASQVANEITRFASKTPVMVIQMCGGQGMREQVQQLRRIQHPAIAVGTPGRVLDHLNKRRLRVDALGYFIIDEVDEMLNFGFKDDMDQIVAHLPTNRRSIILSATLPSTVMKAINEYLTNPKKINAMNDQRFEKPDILEQYYRIKKISKLQLLCRVMDTMTEFYGFIFCNTKREVDDLSQKLLSMRYGVESMHGDLSQAQRNRALERFKTKQCRILVVTDVAARGIDVKNISHVVNFSVPQNLEAYTHRIGRTGRAGQSGSAITFVTEAQMGKFKRLLRTRTIEPCQIPQANDVMRLKQRAFVDQLTDCDVSDQSRGIAQTILKQAPSPEDAVAALIQLHCQDVFGKRRY